jgi:nitrate reductase delta subunit
MSEVPRRFRLRLRRTAGEPGLRLSQLGRHANPGRGEGQTMLWWVRRDPDHAAAIARVREWTRARFALPSSAPIMVAEVACALPGCPPRETVIAFWLDDKRHHWKVFKPVAAVVEADLPPRWLRPALVVPDSAEIDCGC